MHFTRSAIGILALSLSSNIAQAQLLDLGFSPITSNNTENIADQLSASAYDKSQALTDFGTGFSQINTMKDHSSDNSGITEVLFTFSNNVGIESSISEIYFDDGTIFDQTDIINSMSGSTAFSGGTIKLESYLAETTYPPLLWQPLVLVLMHKEIPTKGSAPVLIWLVLLSNFKTMLPLQIYKMH